MASAEYKNTKINTSNAGAIAVGSFIWISIATKSVKKPIIDAMMENFICALYTFANLGNDSGAEENKYLKPWIDSIVNFVPKQFRDKP